MLAAIPLALGLSVFLEFEATHLVRRLPTAVFATGIMLSGILSVACGSILETVTLGRKENKRMTYLAIAPPGAKLAADREALRT